MARAGLRWRRSSASICSARLAADASVKLGEDLLPEDLNPVDLITADIVQIDAVEAEVDELLNFAAMRIGLGRDQHPALEVLRADDLRHLGEVIWRSNIGLGKLHTPVGPLGQGVAHGLLVGRGPRQVQLQNLRQARRVLARLPSALFEALENPVDLFLRRAHRDQPVAEAAGFLGGDRPRGRYVYLR